MEFTKMFRHPKYYKELRKRNKLAESRQPVVGGQQQSDQAISDEASTEATSVRPGPGLKVSSTKLQASSTKRQAFEPTRSIAKRQASQPE